MVSVQLAQVVRVKYKVDLLGLRCHHSFLSNIPIRYIPTQIIVWVLKYEIKADIRILFLE